MADQDPTDPSAPVPDAPMRVISGEAVPPDEHTARVRAAEAERAKAPPANLKVHDDQPSSSVLAERSKRERRRERDRRAERRALQVTAILFLGVGAAGLFLVNSLIEDSPPPTARSSEQPIGEAPPAPPAPNVISTPILDAPDLPALSALGSEGLTIAAEGLPEVVTDSKATGVPWLAALETCRFAYGVWEFSPNKRFRFLTTCEALEGQILVGAYEVDGVTVRMSPLLSHETRIVSTFHVEKPSRITTVVAVQKGEGVVLEVNQRVTTIRAGMEGEAFQSTYAPRNTVQVPGVKVERSAATAPERPKQEDPLLDLLKRPK